MEGWMISLVWQKPCDESQTLIKAVKVCTLVLIISSWFIVAMLFTNNRAWTKLKCFFLRVFLVMLGKSPNCKCDRFRERSKIFAFQCRSGSNCRLEMSSRAKPFSVNNYRSRELLLFVPRNGLLNIFFIHCCRQARLLQNRSGDDSDTLIECKYFHGKEQTNNFFWLKWACCVELSWER